MNNGGWHDSAKHTEAFSGRVDGYSGIHLDKIFQTGRVIAVAVGNHDKIKFAEINTQELYVVLENLSVVSSVKQDELSVVLNECGKSPVLGYFLGLRKGVIQNRDSILSVH